jgi:fatty acid desaturase
MWYLYYLLPLIFAVIDWDTVKRRKKVPDKKLLFYVRASAALLFGCYLILAGYTYYWVIPFLVFGFWWPFNVLMGLFLHWDPFRLSEKDSKIDDVLKKIPFSWYWLLLLFIITGALMAFYGKCTYSEVNAGCYIIFDLTGKELKI